MTEMKQRCKRQGRKEQREGRKRIMEGREGREGRKKGREGRIITVDRDMDRTSTEGADT